MRASFMASMARSRVAASGVVDRYTGAGRTDVLFDVVEPVFRLEGCFTPYETSEPFVSAVVYGASVVIMRRESSSGAQRELRAPSASADATVSPLTGDVTAGIRYQQRLSRTREGARGYELEIKGDPPTASALLDVAKIQAMRRDEIAKCVEKWRRQVRRNPRLWGVIGVEIQGTTGTIAPAAHLSQQPPLLTRMPFDLATSSSLERPAEQTADSTHYDDVTRS